jgi:hypothetical protein
MMSQRWSISAILCLLAGACSSSSNDGDGGITADQACQDQAAATCALESSCSAGWALEHLYGTQTQCVAARKTTCLTNLVAPGATRTSEHVETCAQAMQAESCTDFFSNQTPTACQPSGGTLAAGAVCVNSDQCASNFCAVPTVGAVCGTCAPQPSVGTSCAVTGCGVGLVCGRDSHTCLAHQGDGGTCVESNDCLSGLDCVGLDAGGAPGTCLPNGASSGVSCDVRRLSEASCDTTIGFFCDRPADTCQLATLASAGQPCGGGAADGGNSLCADGGTICMLNASSNCGDGAACIANGSSATCVSPSPVGGPCDLFAGPPCMLPAKCVVDAGSGGLCLLSDPTNCE